MWENSVRAKAYFRLHYLPHVLHNQSTEGLPNLWIRLSCNEVLFNKQYDKQVHLHILIVEQIPE